jgi:hypothetical protein
MQEVIDYGWRVRGCLALGILLFGMPRMIEKGSQENEFVMRPNTETQGRPVGTRHSTVHVSEREAGTSKARLDRPGVGDHTSLVFTVWCRGKRTKFAGGSCIRCQLRRSPQDQRTRSSTRRQVLPSPISIRSSSILKGRGWWVSVKSGAKLPST